MTQNQRLLSSGEVNFTKQKSNSDTTMWPEPHSNKHLRPKMTNILTNILSHKDARNTFTWTRWKQSSAHMPWEAVRMRDDLMLELYGLKKKKKHAAGSWSNESKQSTGCVIKEQMKKKVSDSWASFRVLSGDFLSLFSGHIFLTAFTLRWAWPQLFPAAAH